MTLNNDMNKAGELLGEERFALDADLTIYWPWVRVCWEEAGSKTAGNGEELGMIGDEFGGQD